MSISRSFPPELRLPKFVAAALRLSLLVASYMRTGTVILTQGDTASYLAPGHNLLFHGSFANGALPEIDRTPGYPLFAMLTGMAWNNVLLTAIVQIALSLVTLWFISRIAERCFPQTNAAIIAAWLFAVEPLSIVMNVRLMPETLFLLLLVVFLDRLIEYQATGKLQTLAAAGLLLAAATFVRPVSYYLVFCLTAALAIIPQRERGHRWKAPALLLLTVLPWFAVWQWRNFAQTGYSGFSAIVEKNLYFYQSAEVAAELAHTSFADEQLKRGYPDEAAYLAAHPDQRTWTQPQRLAYMRAQSVQLLGQQRALYLRSHFKGVAIVAFTPAAAESLQLLGLASASDGMPKRLVNESLGTSIASVAHSQPAIVIYMGLLEVFLLLLYGLALYGLLRGKGSTLAKVTLTGCILYFLLISGGAQAVGRYRLPILPEVCILAAGGVAPLRRRNQVAGELEAEVSL